MTSADLHAAYAGHKDVLYRFARRMTGSAVVAEDLVHDCFLMVWRDAVVYSPNRGTMRSFLIGVIRNLALKQLRRERPFLELEEDSGVCEPIDPAGKERGELVAQAVAGLPPLQREAILLAEYEELSLEEIASATGSELAAVKSRLHRARENLRCRLAPLLEMKGQV